MAKGKRTPPDANGVPAMISVSAGSLAGLVGLGFVASLWSLFLWAELQAARSGGDAFCALGDGADCAALWNGAVATAVQRTTTLPLAAWGLVFGLVAAALPLLALLRVAEGRPSPALVSATRLAAVAGVAAVLGLFGVSLSARTLCAGCFVVYVIVAGYAGIALYGWQGAGWPSFRRALRLAAGATAAAVALLLYPASKTPLDSGAAGRAAVAAAPVAPLAAGAGTGDADRDRLLHEFVESLDAPMRQTLADALHITATSPRQPTPVARELLGSAEAPVRIVEWTDALCDHCAGLHDTLATLQERLPKGTFSVDSRHFPLDAACNPLVERREPGSVSCVAAKARLCVTGEAGWKFAGELFASQKNLTVEKVYELAKPYRSRKELEACVASDATGKALAEDIRLASDYDADGTPIVAVNGRRGTSFGPYLYAVILTLGETGHPAFRGLPAPNPNAHMH